MFYESSHFACIESPILRMVADGHFEEVSQIVGRLPGPEQRNAFLFSATLAFTIDRLDKSMSLNGPFTPQIVLPFGTYIPKKYEA